MISIMLLSMCDAALIDHSWLVYSVKGGHFVLLYIRRDADSELNETLQLFP